MYLYIMRHGETQWNKNGLIQGASDIALTEYGEELARVTAEGFSRECIVFDRIYSSPLIRALRTAEIIAQRNLAPAVNGKIFIDDRLREMCFGKYEGERLKEIRQYDQNIDNCFRNPSLYEADETGESFEDVFARIDEFIDREILPLGEDPTMQNVIVICHGTVVHTFLRRFDGVALDDFWNMRQPNCSVNKIKLDGGKFTTVQEQILYYETQDSCYPGIL